MDNSLIILKSLADKNRLRIFWALTTHKTLCACQITELLQVSGATASRHLSQMVNSGILENSKQGRWVYFCLNQKNKTLTDLYKWLKSGLKNTEQAQADQKSLEQILCIPCETLSRNQRTHCSEPLRAMDKSMEEK